jgi:DNA-binding PadR family transcriptional regulator
VARAAVYITLRRLEQKGLVASWMSEATQGRGGKAHRCVKLSRAGLQALRESRHAINQMWSGLDPRLENIR